MKFSEYKRTNHCKGIVGLNKDNNWELVADCGGMTNYQIEKTVQLLNRINKI